MLSEKEKYDYAEQLLMTAYENNNAAHKTIINCFNASEFDVISMMKTIKINCFFDAKKQAGKDKRLRSLFDEINDII